MNDLILIEPGDLQTELQESSLESILSDALAGKNPLTKAKYTQRLRDFLAWRQATGEPLSKALLGQYVEYLANKGLAASTINGHLVALRVMLREAADAGLIDERTYRRLSRVRVQVVASNRTGNWLSQEQAQVLLDAPNRETLIGQRDHAILATMLYTGLRRVELVSLTVGHIQEREGYWMILDLVGKRGRVRSIKLSRAVKTLIDRWLEASGRDVEPKSFVFVPLGRAQKPVETQLTPQSIFNLVKKYGQAIGQADLAPHDLRRSHAKLAHRGGVDLAQLSRSLGHASLSTTERYLGVDLDLAEQPCDFIKLKLNGTKGRANGSK